MRFRVKLAVLGIALFSAQMASASVPSASADPNGPSVRLSAAAAKFDDAKRSGTLCDRMSQNDGSEIARNSGGSHRVRSAGNATAD